MSRPRAVITGLGAVTPLGSTIDGFWSNLLAGRSGIRKITQFDPSGLPCQIAGEIPDFNPTDYLDKKEARRLPRSAQIALAAAITAVEDTGLPDTMPEPERAAVYFGTGIGGLDVFEESNRVFNTKGYSRVNPFSTPGTLPNMPAYAIGREFQCLGPNFTITTACATSTQAIGEASELIRRGAADIVISGGTEAMIRDFAIVGFIAMRALASSYNDNPEQASPPPSISIAKDLCFPKGQVLWSWRNWSMPGSAAPTSMLKSPVTRPLLMASHMAAPDPNGAGPMRAMRWALQDARLNPEEIDYINAHGTSTPLNDPTETRAIKSVFAEHAYHTPISSTKIHDWSCDGCLWSP